MRRRAVASRGFPLPGFLPVSVRDGKLGHMCGRYALSASPEDLVELFGVEYRDPEESLEPDWNIAPTKPVWAVLERPLREAAAEAAGRPCDDRPVRQLRALRWGLVPSWADDPSVGQRMFNARAESVDSKPAYRRPFARRRCLLPADGYFEWHTFPAAEAQQRRVKKQPYYVTARDGGLLAFAGLYEFWRDENRPAGDPSAWVTSCTIVTTAAETEPLADPVPGGPTRLADVHSRMPLVLPADRHAAWLDSELTDAERVRALLEPAPAGTLTVRPIAPAVGDVRNNGPSLLEEQQLTAGPSGD